MHVLQEAIFQAVPDKSPFVDRLTFQLAPDPIIEKSLHIKTVPMIFVFSTSALVFRTNNPGELQAFFNKVNQSSDGKISINMITPGQLGSNNKSNAPVKQSNLITPEAFLQQYGIKVKGNPEKLKVSVPKSWDVRLGDYPEGLYWGLANEFSKDVELDLTRLKGKTVEV